MGRRSDTQQIIYEFVCFNPGKSTYEISKQLKMSGGKVRYALNKLKEMGLIKFKFVKSSYKIKKLSFPIDAWKLLPYSLKRRLKQLKV